ncbi:hypothetical protein KDH83_25820 [Achromobacter sp. Marseille-Q0513]|uniref:hypothetical protein n=1 Tax=Achromobacter sp. Marseille-Q0513 TaxID=2829161 RepID=UPI001B9BF2C0|nr:hypothetical protein [Achromobacter sp. Marseille-Q0513]MBR8656737.1 hypothetical protein [Achromobacter sp. Marseille-Q0513]
MTDRELLELAARAAGIVGTWSTGYQGHGGEELDGLDTGSSFLWNPLVSDGDALRLAVKLCIRIAHMNGFAYALTGLREFEEAEIAAPYAATRRVIVRAAAEIGARKEE